MKERANHVSKTIHITAKFALSTGQLRRVPAHKLALRKKYCLRMIVSASTALKIVVVAT